MFLLPPPLCSSIACVRVRACVCVCVCVRERERESGSGSAFCLLHPSETHFLPNAMQ